MAIKYRFKNSLIFLGQQSAKIKYSFFGGGILEPSVNTRHEQIGFREGIVTYNVIYENLLVRTRISMLTFSSRWRGASG